MQIKMKRPQGGGDSSASITATLMLLLLSVHAAIGRPDVRPSPFALELQPPLAQTAEAFNVAGVGGQRSVDSYGNPIAGLRPIDTPDGRKVVSAQGLQFEIPTYASGITDIRQPADDLLPPHIDLLKGATGTATTPMTAEDNSPFDSSTVPAWLRDFDYPDVGPGVPYNPDNFKEAALTQPAGGSKPIDFRPQGFEPAASRSPTIPPTPIPTRAAPAAASVSSAFPSIVSLPLPGTAQGIDSSLSSTNESPEPPLVLVPPADKPSDDSTSSFASSSTSSSVPQNPSTNSITNFAALFDPQGIQSAVQNQAPKAVTEDQFPPFNAGSSTEGVTKKVEYTKSDEGKVISTPISAQRKDTSTPPSNTGKYTGGFGAPAGLLRPQAPGTSGSGSGANTNPGAANSPDSSAGTYVAGNQHEFSNTLKANRARPTVNPGRYTGGFGAPNGVLSVQAEPRPFQQPQQTQQPDSPSHSSRFGGPPGVLVPFDNVQRAGGQ
ncbi:cell surface glycoprotein 1 isoform X4 [Drosophila pseudoobscura]|uniref:Cell surface glycoprotein 1 isoform X4 n=1 Tax=Drosophila pseudoobscura pseudoobscura TaxID=46245 RepID=A0A6I8VGG7_DROPS|nr:cell surface glycoprotein 1 isoform X4 [Drosophila pseudoobscura]